MPTLADVRKFENELVRPTLEALGEIVGNKQQIASREAVVLLTAIALQESAITHRQQVSGPARGLWQFEKPTVGLTLRHAKVRNLRSIDQALVKSGFVLGDNAEVASQNFRLIETSDRAACVLARLLLWTDSRALSLSAPEMYTVYDTVWRPGKKRPEAWAANYQLALDGYPPEALLATKRVQGLVVTGAATAAAILPTVIGMAIDAGPQLTSLGAGLKALNLPPYIADYLPFIQAAGLVLAAIGVIRARKVSGQ